MNVDQKRDRASNVSDIVAAIERGEVVGIEGAVERIDTHLNHVFLAGKRAYKIKRDRKLPFVDFSSLSKRRSACEAEVRINRSLGSPFYLGVFGVIRRGDQYVLEATEEALEWIVVMTRFDSHQRFDRLLESGGIDLEMLQATARMISAMHARAPVIRNLGHAADYLQIVNDLRRTEQEGASELGLSACAPIYDQLVATLRKLDRLIEHRRAQGRVRRVHGDLHLANLCVFEGKPTPFDALEFDPRLATTDVLYDLAFLLMDLSHANRRREANTVMNCYWDEAQESEDSLRLLPFFMALRAAVRMAVAVPDGRLEHAAGYRDLALNLLQNSVPKAIAIGGLSGTGKSSLAREVAAMLPGSAGARILRTDVIRKQMLSIAPETPAAASAYTTEQRLLTYERMVRQAREASSAGASIVLDATFQDEEARKLMDTGLARTQRFWLEAPLETRLARIGARAADASDASARVAIAQEHGATPPSDWVCLDATLPVEQLARRVVEHLS